VPRLFVVFLASLFLISPSAAGDLMTSDGRPVRTVSVVSQLGDGFHLVQETGKLMSSSTKDSYVPVPGWKIDERIVQSIIQSLGSRFVAVPMTEDEREGRSKPNADVVVWVAAGAEGDHFHVGGDIRRSLLDGLGLYHRTSMLGPDVTGVFAVYDIVIFDAKTRTEIVRRRAKIDWSSHAAEYVYEPLWPGDDKQPSPEQIPPIRDAITNLVDRSLERTLKKLFP